MQTTASGFREELLLKLYAKFGLPILLLVLAILLASCGGTSGGSNKSAELRINLPARRRILGPRNLPVA